MSAYSSLNMNVVSGVCVFVPKCERFFVDFSIDAVHSRLR